jgi:hypothetical protein
MLTVVRALAAAAFVLGAAACGPSFQAIYEGNARFEHCYALEEHPQTPVREKSDCWHDWSERYTYGQTRDRIQYAIARYVALAQAENVPTDEALMMGAPGVTPRVSTITAPAPTNAFAPPPKVLEGDAGFVRPSEVTHSVGVPETPPPPPPAPPPLPSQDCGGTCASTFYECKGGCDPDAGAKKSCAACEKTYRGCMKGCFK